MQKYQNTHTHTHTHTQTYSPLLLPPLPSAPFTPRHLMTAGCPRYVKEAYIPYICDIDIGNQNFSGRIDYDLYFEVLATKGRAWRRGVSQCSHAIGAAYAYSMCVIGSKASKHTCRWVHSVQRY